MKSGWISPDGESDGHITKTSQTAGGTVAHTHLTEEVGPDAADPAKVSQCYTDAMLPRIRGFLEMWRDSECDDRLVP